MKTKYDFFGFALDKEFKHTFALLILTMFIGLTLANFVFAQGETAGGTVKTILACYVCKVFQLIFYIAAAIAALVVIVAGIKWIGSGDDPSARGAAKSTVVHAVIGLIIVLIAVYLVWWIAGAVANIDMADPSSFIKVGGCDKPCGVTTPVTI